MGNVRPTEAQVAGKAFGPLILRQTRRSGGGEAIPVVNDESLARKVLEAVRRVPVRCHEWQRPYQLLDLIPLDKGTLRQSTSAMAG